MFWFLLQWPTYLLSSVANIQLASVRQLNIIIQGFDFGPTSTKESFFKLEPDNMQDFAVTIIDIGCEVTILPVATGINYDIS